MKRMKTMLAYLLCIAMLAGLFPSSVFAANVGSPVEVAQSETKSVVDAAIIFTDLHTSKNNYKDGTIQNIFDALKATNLPFSSVTSGGDAFSVNENNSSSNGPYSGYTETISTSIRNALGNSKIPVNYVWSDHDRYAYQENETDTTSDDTTLLDKTSHLTYGAGTDGVYGTDDDGNYYVYALSMGDLCSYDRYSAGFNTDARSGSGFTSTVAKAIENFKADAEKLKKDRPLFIVSHQPLFDRRDDNAFAEQWFDAINEVALNMDVAFFFGHNHKYDEAGDYLYQKGDQLPVATKDKWTSYETGVGYLPSVDLSSESKTLNFTHMCAGYMDPRSTRSYNDETTRENTAVAITIYNDSINFKSVGAGDNYKGNFVLDETVARDHAIQEPVLEATDTNTKTTLSAPGVTSVSVTKTNVNPNPSIYKAYAKYDINPVGYTDGKMATVSIELDDNFSVNGNVTVLDVKNQTSSVWPVVNRVVTFTTNHFSEYDVMEIDESIMLQATGTLKEKQIVQITQTSELVNGNGYVLVSNTGNGTLTKTINNNNRFTLVSGTVGDHVWYYENGGFYCLDSNGNKQWMTIEHQSVSLLTTRDTTKSVSSVTISTNSTFRLSNASGIYLNKEGAENSGINGGAHGWNAADNNSNWRIYKLVETPVILSVAPASIEFYMSSGAATQQLMPVVKVNGNETTDYTLSYSSSDTNVVTVDNNGLVAKRAVGTANIVVTLTKANKKDLSSSIQVTIPVTVLDVSISSVTIDSLEGSVPYKSDETTKTGSKLTVTYSDGSTSIVDVTVDMLTGTFNLAQNDTYSGLSLNDYQGHAVTYNGIEVNNYTLTVLAPNNFPEYPNPGSVALTKTAEPLNQNTGLTRIDLTASGLPVNKGVDVIVMLDTSSSMDRCVKCGKYTGKYTTDKSKACQCTGTVVTRVDELLDALEELEKTLKEAGNPENIRIAIADFNGMYTTGPCATDSNDDTEDKDGLTNGGNTQVFTSDSDNLDLSAFITADQLDVSKDIVPLFTNSSTHTGTNYDYGFDTIYQLGNAIKKDNKSKNVERDLYVMFMSDGAPNQYNFYRSTGGDNGSTDWNYWLQGTAGVNGNPILEDIVDCDTHTYYYDSTNGNQHRMANAIKGSSSQQYNVIRKSKEGLEELLIGQDPSNNIYSVPGLDAKMFSIAFHLTNDGTITRDSAEKVLKSFASTENMYVDAENGEILAKAFREIATEIAYAATNASYTDIMGDDFKLQLGSVVKSNSIDSKDGMETVDTSIIVKSENVYTPSQVGTTVLGHQVTEADVGKVYGDATILEKVVFDETGTNATSDQLTDEIILNDGIICAKTFVYNTTNAVKEVTLADGSIINVGPEEFYWTIGTINQKRYTLSYVVYLKGSMEGTREAGSYETNDLARLDYNNWIGNRVSQTVPSPVVAWGKAQVSYAFYLVNDQGQPLYSDGSVAPNFGSAYKVTKPVVYGTINLNSSENVISALGENVLPEGYELYDASANYTISPLSGDHKDAGWTIVASDEKKLTDSTSTTYVTGYAGANNYTNEMEVREQTYAYTDTTVYFAVKWSIQALPDTVVIDYGLPVDISVLANDMFGDKGKLIGVGKSNPLTGDVKYGSTSVLETTYTGTYGATGIKEGTGGVATSEGSKVRYTPNTMEFNGVEKFVYEVEYTKTNTDGNTELQYYYGDVSVIPASTVYYEDNFNGSDRNDFITYTKYTKGEDGTYSPNGTWKTVGTENTAATQAEDRPGKYSLSWMDANNIYGYDAAYSTMTEYSLGTAEKIHVDANNYGTAQFTFYGTGFDIISMTDNTTGTLILQVYKVATDGTETLETSFAVNTYYGYSYSDENGWQPVTDVNEESIYQVPVMEVEGLDYGKYKVVLNARYYTAFDDTTPDGYDLYLDAVRIYDPIKTDAVVSTKTVTNEEGTANVNTTVQDVYKEDTEAWPVYFELRNNVLNAATVTSAGDKKVTGMVFIDGISETASFADYGSYGPNNELYLAPGQAIAFNMDLSSYVDSKGNGIVAGVHMGIKNALKTSATYKIFDAAAVSTEEDLDAITAKTLNTSTDMYYDITALRNKTIVIANTGSEGILSLTNVKLTFTEAPATAVSNLFYINGTVSETLINSLNTDGVFDDAEKIVVNVPKTAYVGNSIEVTVQTSDYVSAVQINDEIITLYYEDATNGSRLWKNNISCDTAEEKTIKVVGYNKDGAVSEAVETTVTISNPTDIDTSSVITVIRNLIVNIFNWLKNN